MKVVIVGGVAGGASAAARLRRLKEDASIVILERGPDVSFANCGMPYFIGGEIEEREKLLVAKPQLLRNRFRIDVRTRVEATRIDRDRKVIEWTDLATGDKGESPYDHLILSPGASPVLPSIPGVKSAGVHTLRNLDDADRILAGVAQARRAIVVGGGFIGLEMAENLARRGLKTVLLQRDAQVLGFLDGDLAHLIHQELRKAGIELHLNANLTQIEGSVENQNLRGVLEGGLSIDTDMVVLGIGVQPESRLAAEAGLKLGPRGCIEVDSQMRTSDPSIYAVGDAVGVIHQVSGQTIHLPLAGPANRQGRIAADAIAGRTCGFAGVLGTAIIRVFSKTAATTGLNSRQLKSLGIPFETVIIHPADHARYFPGAEEMTLKLFFHATTGKILGAQGVGGKGVDKRIDVIAMALQKGADVFDLEEAELCYAPQYGSAKDPVNMLGFVAAGALRQDHPQITAHQLLEAWPKVGFSILDVRTPKEFEGGHLPGAVNLPVDELRLRVSELNSGQPYLVYCQVGMRGYLATRILLQNGFQVRNLSGGFFSWRQAQGPTVP